MFFVLSATVSFATQAVSVSCVTLDTQVLEVIAILHAQVAATPHHATIILVFAVPVTQCSLLIRSTTSAFSATSVAVPLATAPTLARPAILTSSSATTLACVPATPLQTLPTLLCVPALVASPMIPPTTSVLITAESATVSLVEEAYAVPVILDINFPTMFAIPSALSLIVRAALSVDSAPLALQDSSHPPMVMLVSCAMLLIVSLARPTIFVPFARPATVLLEDSVSSATLLTVFNAPLPMSAPHASEISSQQVETLFARFASTLVLPAVPTMSA